MRKGHIYKTTEHDGECLRTAVATVTGWPRKKMPWINPDSYPAESWEWWHAWDRFLHERGMRFREFSVEHGYPKDYWIAIVQSHRDNVYRHALVMKGSKVISSNSGAFNDTYDINFDEIHYGLEVVPL